MTALYRELPRTPRAARTVLATALTTCTALPDPYATADKLLQHLVLVPAVSGLRSDWLTLIAALQDHLPPAAGNPVWLAEALADEIHTDGWAARPLIQPLLCWVA